MIVIQTTPNKNKGLIAKICAIAAVVLMAAALVGCSALQTDNGLILDDVYAAGIHLGGQTPEQAKVLVQRQTDLTYPYEDMVVTFPDGEIRLSPADTGVTLDIDKLIEDAYNYGRTVNKEDTDEYHLDLSDYLTMDITYIQAQLDAYRQAQSSDFAEATVTIEGERPALDAANYKEENPCQTIVIFTGNPGHTLDLGGVLQQILAAYGANEFQVTLDVVPKEQLPTAIDLEGLLAEHSVDPVDATLTKDSNGKATVTPESYGYFFDLEEAQTLMAEAGYNQTLEIPFRYMAPGVLSKDLLTQSENNGNKDNNSTGLYQDVLASYKTVHTSNSNRNTNLKLACKAINGKVLMPGEKFDYNTALGKRTAEKGYKEAIGYTNGASVNQLGGGICQVSSTLYYCTLIADLKINVRRAHSYVSSYMPLGMDATVSWGGPDFAFTNNTGYPLKIEAYVSGGYVHVKLLGTNTKSYSVKMEYEVLSTKESSTEYKKMTAAEAKAAGYRDGEVIQTAYTGHLVKSYKCKYDLNTGKLISRTYEATSDYKSRNKIVVKIVDAEKPTEKPTEAPTEAPTTKPTEAPTVAPTTKPTEAPTVAPTTPPTEAPTVAPTTPPTEAPTQAPTEAPTAPPTEAPTEAPTQAPTEAPAEAATTAALEEPVEATTESPAEAPETSSESEGE